MNCVSWQDQRHICNNARVTPIALSRRAVHLSPRCITYTHHVHKLAICANRAHRAPQTMQSSAVMSIKTPHTLSNIANPSAASYLALILHIDTARHHRKPPCRTTAPRRSSHIRSNRRQILQSHHHTARKRQREVPSR